MLQLCRHLLGLQGSLKTSWLIIAKTQRLDLNYFGQIQLSCKPSNKLFQALKIQDTGPWRLHSRAGSPVGDVVCRQCQPDDFTLIKICMNMTFCLFCCLFVPLSFSVFCLWFDDFLFSYPCILFVFFFFKLLYVFDLWVPRFSGMLTLSYICLLQADSHIGSHTF